jgi:hypothetical protein
MSDESVQSVTLRSPRKQPETARGVSGTAIQALSRSVLFAASLLIAVFAIYMITSTRIVDEDWAVLIAVTSIVWLLIYFVSVFGMAGTPYLLSSTYVIAFSLFHLGITVPDGLNLFPDITWGFSQLAPWLDLAGWYTILALCMFGAGLSTGWRSGASGSADRNTPKAVFQASRQTATWAGVGLLLASAVFLLLAFVSYGNIFAYERAELFHSGADSRGWGAFMMTLPSATILIWIGANGRSAKVLTAVFALAVVGLFLLIGYRSAALFPALVGVVLWAKTGNKIPTLVAVALIAGTAVAIPAAGVWRAFTAYNEISSETIMSSVDDTEAKDTLEQGRTAGVLAHVLRLVPEHDPYRWGLTYLRTIPLAIPNVLSRMGESKRGNVSNAVLKDKAILELPPASWITYKLTPDKFHSGEGVGFSSVGEAYLNFGLGGVVGLFFIFGILFARLDSLNLLYHPYLLIFAGAMLWPLIRTVRNDATNFVKPAGFLLISLLIWAVITKLIPVIRPGKLPNERPLSSK